MNFTLFITASVKHFQVSYVCFVMPPHRFMVLQYTECKMTKNASFTHKIQIVIYIETISAFKATDNHAFKGGLLLENLKIWTTTEFKNIISSCSQ